MKAIGIRAIPFTVIALVLALPAGAADDERARLPGFVDGSVFLEQAGDDDGTIEVSLHGPLLRALLSTHPELKRMVGGLESIHAVVLELADGDRARKARASMRRTEAGLLDRGWELLAKIRDGGADVTLLVLNDEETIQGLVVMVADEGERQVVFANVAGVIDLAAIASLGETLEIPGLDQVGERD